MTTDAWSKVRTLILCTVFLMMPITISIAKPESDITAATPDTSQTHPIFAVLLPEKKATISSPMAGLIQKLSIQEGSQFKKDEILLQFDCRLANAELKKAKAQLKLKIENERSYQRLYKLSSTSKMQLAQSKAELQQAIAALNIAKKNVGDCIIKAPFSGQVTTVHAHQHEVVKLHQPLFDILANRPLYLKVLVPAAWINWLKVNTEFKIDIAGKSYPATVTRVVNEIDPVSQTIKVIAKLKGDFKELKPGMNGKAIFDVPKLL